MKFDDNSDVFTLNRTTYVNLRWIAFIGQISSIFVVEFYGVVISPSQVNIDSAFVLESIAYHFDTKQ